MRSRPWAWLRQHIRGLVTKPQHYGPMGEPIPATRVQALIAARTPRPHPAAVNE